MVRDCEVLHITLNVGMFNSTVVTCLVNHCLSISYCHQMAIASRFRVNDGIKIKGWTLKIKDSSTLDSVFIFSQLVHAAFISLHDYHLQESEPASNCKHFTT